MPWPFRSPAPVNTEDSPEWQPPDYAVASKDEEWKPPSYAKEDTKELEKKPSVFSKIISALKPSERIHGPDNSEYVEKYLKNQSANRNQWDKRSDGTQKGDGFLGIFKLPNNYLASEYSIADSEKLKGENGNYLEYPTLVPTLTKEEIQSVLKAASDSTRKTPLPDSVYDKAEAHALLRKKQGLPLFARPGEEDYTKYPELERGPHYDSSKKPELPNFTDTVKNAEKKVWQKASEPLTDAPSRFAQAVSQYVNPERTTKGLKGIGSAYIESLGNTISGLSSPLNLALTATGAGEAYGLRGAGVATKALSAPVVAEGAKNIYQGVKNKDVLEALSGGLEAGTGMLGFRGSRAPIEEPPIRQRLNDYVFKSREAGAAKPPVKETPISEPTPRAAVQDFIKKNPDAKMADVEKFINDVSGKETQTSNIKTEEWKPPSYAEEAKIEDIKPKEEKKPFVNPFEKPKNIETNASGESSASLEAINRQKSMKDNGKQFVVYDKAGNERPLIGPEAVDYTPKKGETYGVKDQNGFKLLEDNGGKIPQVSTLAERNAARSARIKANSEILDTSATNLKSKTEDIQGQLDNAGRPLMGSANRLKPIGEEWKPPSYAQPIQKGEVQLGNKTSQIIEHPLINQQTGEIGTPESLHPQLTGLKNYGDGVLYTEFDKNANMTPEKVKALFPDKNVDVTEMATTEGLPSRFRIDVKGNDPVHSQQLGDEIERSVGGAFDKENQPESLLTGQSGTLKLGGDNPSVRALEPNKGPYGAALDKLFNSMGNIKEQRLQQDIMNKAERAKRFAAFSSVDDVGVKGAAQSLSKLKGEFDKVDFDRLKMTPPQVDSLFTAVKRANITPGEKARGYTALFKLMNGESLPQRNELAILDNVFGNGFADKITQMHGGIGAVGLNIAKLANTMKSMQNSISLAAPLRHGIGLVARKEFYPAFADMFKFFANKDYYNTAMESLEKRPNYILGRESGLFLSKPNSLQNSEEEFLNSYVGKIPLVRDAVGASNRAYTGFLNKLRADTFDSMTKQAEGLGYKMANNVDGQIMPTKEAEAIGRYINNATGRGSLGSLNKMTNELNLLLWSPRMISSRLTMLTNPKIYMDLPKGMRLDGLKSLLGIAALGTTIDTLASYAGAKVGTNILSSDFGKSRFGKDVIDPWGGFQQYIVGAARFLAGKTDSSQPTDRLSIAGRFLANKESPIASLIHTILTSKPTKGSERGVGNITTEYGQKTNVLSEIAKRFEPIFIQDIQDLIKTQPDWADNIGLTAAMTGASLAGMSQNYPERQNNRLKIRKMVLQ